MKIRVAIVGLPNVGKSALFNALAQKSLAHSANFPFCTVEPNVAPLPVPDAHLRRLGAFAGSTRTVPATLRWVDVAGLVAGASRGEGLGNRFLATCRECDAVCHLVRCFEDPDVVHVDGRVDAAADAEVVELELLLADLAHVERRLEKTTCGGLERDTLEAVAEGLQLGAPARTLGLSDAAAAAIKSMGLLTLKPVLYAFNVDEVDFTFGREEALTRAREVLASLQHYDPVRDQCVLVSAKLEAEISARTASEQREYLESLGMEPEPGRAPDSLLSHTVLPLAIVRLLDLSLAYTGPGVPAERSRTTRAHLVPSDGLTAAGLAAKLHGDIQKGFIRAEVASAAVLLQHPDYAAAKEAGCVRGEGKEYALRSDDVVLVKWK